MGWGRLFLRRREDLREQKHQGVRRGPYSALFRVRIGDPILQLLVSWSKVLFLSPAVPLCIISALDDPVVGTAGIPFEAARQNPNVLLVATQHVWHLGWCEGVGKGYGYASDVKSPSWTEEVVLDFFENALQHKSENETV